MLNPSPQRLSSKRFSGVLDMFGSLEVKVLYSLCVAPHGTIVLQIKTRKPES